MARSRASPPASAETKINMWLNIAAIVVPLLVTAGGGLVFVGSLTATIREQVSGVGKDVDLKIQPLANKVDQVSNKVDLAAKDGQARVDQLATKVEASTQLTQAKTDALTSKVDGNIAEQQTFRASVQTGFTKLFDKQQALSDAIQQEKVDRLTEASKKK